VSASDLFLTFVERLLHLLLLGIGDLLGLQRLSAFFALAGVRRLPIATDARESAAG